MSLFLSIFIVLKRANGASVEMNEEKIPESEILKLCQRFVLLKGENVVQTGGELPQTCPIDDCAEMRPPQGSSFGPVKQCLPIEVPL